MKRLSLYKNETHIQKYKNEDKPQYSFILNLEVMLIYAI